jgi:hypothetical protein
MSFIDSNVGRIIISVVWGLGLSALFRRACNGRKCIVVKGPKPSQFENKIYGFNNKFYTYQPYSVTCKKSGNIPI